MVLGVEIQNFNLTGGNPDLHIPKSPSIWIPLPWAELAGKIKVRARTRMNACHVHKPGATAGFLNLGTAGK